MSGPRTGNVQTLPDIATTADIPTAAIEPWQRERSRLLDAAEIIGEVRAELLLRAERKQASRLQRLAMLVDEEAAVLEGNRWQLTTPDNAAPEGAGLGWFLRYDAHCRRARELLGLSTVDPVEPEAEAVDP